MNRILSKGQINHIVVTAALTALLLIAFTVFSDQAGAGTRVRVRVGGQSFNGVLYDNPTSKALMKKMPISYKMSELNNNEKYKYLDYTLPTDEKAVKRIKAGDIMLYGDDCLVLFYESFDTSYEYTPVGKITNTKGLKKAAGKGAVTVKIARKAKVALNRKTLTLRPGKAYTLKLNGAAKNRVKWKSSDKSVLTVSKGKVRAKKAGRARVTATYKKKQYVCRVTVRRK